MVVLFNIFDDNSIVKLDIINKIHTFNFRKTQPLCFSLVYGYEERLLALKFPC